MCRTPFAFCTCDLLRSPLASHLARRPTYYVSYVVFPIVIVTIITWASFFISRAAVPARVAMVIIAFLSLTGSINSILATLPRLSGPVWLLELAQISQVHVFIACVECKPSPSLSIKHT